MSWEIQEIIVFILFAVIVFYALYRLVKKKSSTSTGCGSCDFNPEKDSK